MNKATTTIDAAGRLVIPKALREEYGMGPGQRVELIPGDEGLTIVPERPQRRFVRRGRVLALDTGAGPCPLGEFDVSRVRDEHLREKAGENWG